MEMVRSEPAARIDAERNSAISFRLPFDYSSLLLAPLDPRIPVWYIPGQCTSFTQSVLIQWLAELLTTQQLAGRVLHTQCMSQQVAMRQHGLMPWRKRNGRSHVRPGAPGTQ